MEGVLFQSPSEMLEELRAKDNGRYFLADCPCCKTKGQAFMYKNNLNVIFCNRNNNCGSTTRLQYSDINGSQELPKRFKVEEQSSMSKEKQDQLSLFSKMVKFGQRYSQVEQLEEYRGLGRAVTLSYIYDIGTKENVKKLYEQFDLLFKETYAKSENMMKRNIMIPIFNEKGRIDRVLLRSTIDKVEPKEIQLRLNESNTARDFIVDMDTETKTIIFAESLLDGLSFKEVDLNVGVVGLTGALKTKGICEWIEKNQEELRSKEIVLALDDDKAGKTCSEKLEATLRRLNIPCKSFSYADNYKDPNDFLRGDRALFERHFFDCIDVDVKKEQIQEESKSISIHAMKMFKTQRGEPFTFCSLKYGDVILTGITVRERDGIPVVEMPSEKDSDSLYREVFFFNKHPPKDYDHKLINRALMDGYKEMVREEKGLIVDRHIGNKKQENAEITFTKQRDEMDVSIDSLTFKSVEKQDDDICLPSYLSKGGKEIPYVTVKEEVQEKMKEILIEDSKDKTRCNDYER